MFTHILSLMALTTLLKSYFVYFSVVAFLNNYFSLTKMFANQTFSSSPLKTCLFKVPVVQLKKKLRKRFKIFFFLFKKESLAVAFKKKERKKSKECLLHAVNSNANLFSILLSFIKRYFFV